MNISFIGFGNMAKAIAAKLAMQEKYILKAAAPSLTAGINPQRIETHHDNLAVLPEADVVILAVKPKQMASVMTAINPAISKKTLLVSVAAGISLAWFEQFGRLAVVRAMPNIGSTVGKGATPLAANQWVNDDQKKHAESIFNTTGITTWVEDEAKIDAFTALSGSGPAYVFLFMENMIQAACELGLDKATATAFTLQTIEGALNLARESRQDITELRKKVTSPAGTTAAAIDVLQGNGLDKLISSAMNAAFTRAKELGSLN